MPGAVRMRHALRRCAVRGRADAVVLVTQRLSNEALYLELAGDAEALAASGIEAVYRTGDCVAPRWLVDTVFDGHRLAREIDSPNPPVYLPTLRERGLPPQTDSMIALPGRSASQHSIPPNRCESNAIPQLRYPPSTSHVACAVSII